MGLSDDPFGGERDWASSVKAYYRDVEHYDWVDVADNFRGLEAIFHKMRERLVRRFVMASGASTFLDAGCGTGLNLRHLPPGSIGIDINPRNLALIRERLEGYPLVLGDVENLPFDDESFEAVLCTEVIEHVPDPVTALSEIFRVLEPGGVLIGSVPTLSPIWKLRFLSSTCPHQEPFHNQYSRSQMRRLLGAYETRVVKYALVGTSLVFVVERPV